MIETHETEAGMDAEEVKSTQKQPVETKDVERTNSLLADLCRAELEMLALEMGQPAYRGEQLFRWIGRGVTSFEQMTDIPSGFRAQLEAEKKIGLPKIIDIRNSQKDETVKYVLALHDGNLIESVLMKYHHGYSVCVSTQAGCRMGCRFCASKPDGFARNLSAGEMFGQICAVQVQTGKKVGHVVLMGVGEPFDNYDQCLRFIRLLHENSETSIGYRKVTISTSGIVPGILRLADEGLPIGLSVSLHAPNDQIRNRLMPVSKKYSIDKLLEGCKIYTQTGKRRITFEYAMIHEINDQPAHAVELAKRLRGMLCHVNLIPVNSVAGTEFKPSERAAIAEFEGILKKRGIEVTVRRELGSDIDAACGQLRSEMMKSQ